MRIPQCHEPVETPLCVWHSSSYHTFHMLPARSSRMVPDRPIHGSASEFSDHFCHIRLFFYCFRSYYMIPMLGGRRGRSRDHSDYSQSPIPWPLFPIFQPNRFLDFDVDGLLAYLIGLGLICATLRTTDKLSNQGTQDCTPVWNLIHTRHKGEPRETLRNRLPSIIIVDFLCDFSGQELCRQRSPLIRRGRSLDPKAAPMQFMQSSLSQRQDSASNRSS